MPAPTCPALWSAQHDAEIVQNRGDPPCGAEATHPTLRPVWCEAHYRSRLRMEKTMRDRLAKDAAPKGGPG